MECKAINEEQLSPPYVLTHNKLVAMFQDDPAIEVNPLNDEDRTCTIRIKNYFKYLIYKEAFIIDFDYDNAGLLVKVVYDGPKDHLIDEVTLGYLLESNPHFLKVIKSENPMMPLNSVVFKKEVLQYYSDNFFSPYGHDSILAQDLIKEFLENPEVNTCTDTHPIQ